MVLLYQLSYTGFLLYLENLDNLEFCHLHFQAWKIPAICSNKKLETLELTPGKNFKFVNSVFPNSLF